MLTLTGFERSNRQGVNCIAIAGKFGQAILQQASLKTPEAIDASCNAGLHVQLLQRADSASTLAISERHRRQGWLIAQPWQPNLNKQDASPAAAALYQNRPNGLPCECGVEAAEIAIKIEIPSNQDGFSRRDSTGNSPPPQLQSHTG